MPRVLVIEDDATISDLIADVLRGYGFDVDTAENGAEGMARVRDSPPDLITLDLIMPVMDGWEFIRRCGELPDCANRPILVVSVTEPKHELLEHCSFLAKPFDMDELIEAVARLTP